MEKRWMSNTMPDPGESAGARSAGRHSEGMLGPLDDVLLEHAINGGEEHAEAGHPDHQVSMVLGVCLRLAQEGRADDVELVSRPT